MIRRIPSIMGLLVALLLVVSFVVPVNMASPTGVKADPGILEWTIIDTPDSVPKYTKEIYTPGVDGGPDMGSEITKLLIGPDGNTMWCIAVIGMGGGTAAALPQQITSQARFLKSTNGGRQWSGTPYSNLASNMNCNTSSTAPLVWDIAMAPDSNDIMMVAVSRIAVGANVRQQEVWITVDGGNNFDNTQWPPVAPAVTIGTQFISAMDISVDYGGVRKVLVALRGGLLFNNPVYVMKIPGFGGWNIQNAAGAPASSGGLVAADVLDAHFSPTFGGDSTLLMLYSNVNGTFLATGSHDIANNQTVWQAVGQHVEIKNSTSPAGTSPTSAQIITGMIAMPTDYSGQSASLRRVYVSTDAVNAVAAPPTPNTGVYRIDDNVVYTLMDNSSTWGTVGLLTTIRRAASIAYWGTYASGKLLVGERLGYACQAAVPVWFTDSPTVCPIPCWYPSKKPPTGAAGQCTCEEGTHGYGNAFVVWSPKYADQGVAYAVTGSSSLDVGGTAAAVGAAPGTIGVTTTWPAGIFNYVRYDESAMSLTRNNGETWNQMALVDTLMLKLTDVAVSMDCSTVYLASVNNGTEFCGTVAATGCDAFDSVWRSTSNAAVVDPPLPALPIGQVWERVRTSPTALTCSKVQSDYAILRLAPDKLDGQIVFWGAGGTGTNQTAAAAAPAILPVIGNLNTGGNTLAAAWSPDYGDYWANMNPRINIQDMAAESSTILYVLDATGRVQKLPYTGTAWASTVLTTNTNLSAGHTIEAMAEGKVLVGAGQNQAFIAGFSTNGATSWTSWFRTPPTLGNWHAIFDPDFNTNKIVYAADDQVGRSNLSYAGPALTAPATLPATPWTISTGRIYRNNTDGTSVEWTDMVTNMAIGNYSAADAAQIRGFYGIVATNAKNISNEPTLYAAHAPALITTAATLNYTWSGVLRTLTARTGIPKPGIAWDDLIAAATFFQTFNPLFTLEPKSLKYCGCLTADTNTTLYAIDNDFYANNHNVRKTKTDTTPSATLLVGTGSIPGPAAGAGSILGGMVPPGIVAGTNNIGAWPPAPYFLTGVGVAAPAGYSMWPVRATGMLWSYTDCVAKRGPKLTMDDGTIIGCDPASGRNQEVNFTWEQLCVANQYQLQVAKDSKFTLMMFDSPIFIPVSVTSPAMIFMTGGGATSPVTLAPPALECGHKYFWRVRVRGAVTGEIIRSPWSDIRSFTIKAGFRVTTPYYGPQLLEPINGCGCACDAPLNFSWSPFKETQKYKFELSENPDMTSPVVSVEVGTTAYQYKGTIKCNIAYFWRVMATQPAPSEWSAVFTFKTQKAVVPPAPTPVPEEKTPMWVWVLIALGAILAIVTLVLIFKTRRV